jgi:hypothetical protein
VQTYRVVCAHSASSATLLLRVAPSPTLGLASATPLITPSGTHGLTLSAHQFASRLPNTSLLYEWRYLYAGVELPLSEATADPTLHVRALPAGEGTPVVYVSHATAAASGPLDAPTGTRVQLPAVTVVQPLPVLRFRAAAVETAMKADDVAAVAVAAVALGRSYVSSLNGAAACAQRQVRPNATVCPVALSLSPSPNSPVFPHSLSGF